MREREREIPIENHEGCALVARNPAPLPAVLVVLPAHQRAKRRTRTSLVGGDSAVCLPTFFFLVFQMASGFRLTVWGKRNLLLFLFKSEFRNLFFFFAFCFVFVVSSHMRVRTFLLISGMLDSTSGIPAMMDSCLVFPILTDGSPVQLIFSIAIEREERIGNSSCFGTVSVCHAGRQDWR